MTDHQTNDPIDPRIVDLLVEHDELLDPQLDVDSEALRPLLKAAGLTAVDLVQLRRVAASVEFESILRASELEHDAPGLDRVHQLVQGLAADQRESGMGQETLERSPSQPKARSLTQRGFWVLSSAVVAGAAAAVLFVILRSAAGSAEPSPGELPAGSVLGAEDRPGLASVVDLDSRSFLIPHAFRPGDTVLVTLEAEAGEEWRAIGSKEVETPKVTLGGAEWQALRTALQAPAQRVRARFEATSADGSASVWPDCSLSLGPE